MAVEKRTIRSDIPGGDSYMEQMSSQDEKKLTVGRGISLSGEITSCDHLVVEGYLEASIKNALRVDINPSGHFNGQIEVEDAEIYGYFEGDIIVRNRLIIHSGACVSGNLQYGALQVETGAVIIGNISMLKNENAASNSTNVSEQFSGNITNIEDIELQVA